MGGGGDKRNEDAQLRNEKHPLTSNTPDIAYLYRCNLLCTLDGSSSNIWVLKGGTQKRGTKWGVMYYDDRISILGWTIL